MEKIIFFFQKLKYYVLISIFLFIYYYEKILYSCEYYKELIFDSQNFIVWDYAKSIGVVPFRDIFFPYGIFYYYKDQIQILTIVYFFLIVLFFCVMYSVIQYFWKSNFISLVFFILFFLFIEHITGVETFARYGLAVSGVLLFALYILKKKNIQGRVLFFSGICISFCFSFIPDQGLYLLFAIPIITITHTIFLKDKIKNKFLFFSCISFFYFLGFALGLLPLAVYLLITEMPDFYMSHLYLLFNIADYAKAPYIPTLKSMNEIFILAVLISAFTYLVHLFLIAKKPARGLPVFAITLVLIMFEQKSVMRSISTSLTFIAFLLLILLSSVLVNGKALKSRMEIMKVIVIFFLFYAFVFYFGLTPVYRLKNNEGKCAYAQNFSFLKDQKNYMSVVSELKKDTNTIPKIYSFPNDPIFYILFSQKPPYFLNIYDASSTHSQEKQINYIKNMDINYIIYNSLTYATQDGVPDVVRGSYLLRYILTNFTYYKTVDNFLIFKKSKLISDFAENTEVYKYFSSINLGFIPYSEGRYKKDNLPILSFTTIGNFNAKLLKKPFDTKNMVILVSAKSKSGKTAKISLWSRNLASKISFKECVHPDVCIINLERIPLFLNEKKLTRVTIEGGYEVLITAAKVRDENNFW